MTSWIKSASRNSNNLRYADDTTLMAESEEELKSLLMKVKESEKVGLNVNIQKTNIMASDPITSWQIDGETAETVADFIFLGSKITEDGGCSREIYRCLLLGRKVMANLDSILMQDTGCLGLVHWDDPEGWEGRGGKWEGGSGWGTRVYLWWIHVDVWQNQYNIVK